MTHDNKDEQSVKEMVLQFRTRCADYVVAGELPDFEAIFEEIVHHQLQKAREEERERIANKIQVQIDYYSDYANDGGKVDERLATLLWCKRQAELDQDTSPVHKFFTAPEETQRPLIEEAIKKASAEQAELYQDKQ